VLPRFRRRGIGTHLMDEAERKVSERSDVAGIGVGMSPDYGAAQRLYILRGYVPDGKGLTSNGSPVSPGDEITVNDGLVLYLRKALPAGNAGSVKRERPRRGSYGLTATPMPSVYHTPLGDIAVSVGLGTAGNQRIHTLTSPF
jgi:hypothetical protein